MPTADEIRDRLSRLLDEKNCKIKEFEDAGGPTEDQRVELEMLNEDIASARRSLKSMSETSNFRVKSENKHVPRLSRFDPSYINAFDAHPIENIFSEDIDTREKIKTVLASVPARTPLQREIFKSYIVNGSKMVEIGEEMGISAATVSRTLFRACANIRGQSEIVLKALDACDPDYRDMYVIDAKQDTGKNFLHLALTDYEYSVFWRHVVERKTLSLIAAEDGAKSSSTSRVFKNARLRIYQCVPFGLPVVISDLSSNQVYIASPLPYRKYPYPARTEGTNCRKDWERKTGYNLGK